MKINVTVTNETWFIDVARTKIDAELARKFVDCKMFHHQTVDGVSVFIDKSDEDSLRRKYVFMLDLDQTFPIGSVLYFPLKSMPVGIGVMKVNIQNTYIWKHNSSIVDVMVTHKMIEIRHLKASS